MPVLRVVDLFPVFQAADEREIAALRLRLVLEEDPPPLGYEVVQRAIRHIAVGCKHPDARLPDLAQTGDKNLVVVIVFKGMDFVKDDLAGAHTVPALGVVGAALHDALVAHALDHLFRVVVVLFQLCLPLGGFQHIREVLYRHDRLLLVVGTDIHIVFFNGVVWRNGARPVKGNEPVFPSPTTYHAQRLLPSWPPISPVSAVPQRQQKFLPREKPLVGEILQQAKVVPELFRVHIDVLLREHAAHIGHQGVLLRTGAGIIGLDDLDIAQNLRGDLTAHRRHRPGRQPPERPP